jgi:hypothetical protein
MHVITKFKFLFCSNQNLINRHVFLMSLTDCNSTEITISEVTS